MGFISKIFKQRVGQQPNDQFNITITSEYIRVEHPKRKTEEVNWEDINEIAVMTTDEGPFLPDSFLILNGGDKGGCLIPTEAEGYNDVFDIVAKFEGFDFKEYVKAAGSVENEIFQVWAKKE